MQDSQLFVCALGTMSRMRNRNHDQGAARQFGETSLSAPDSTQPKTYLYIDGDGPREVTEEGLTEAVMDVLLSNEEVTFKRKEIVILGMPVTCIEVE